MLLIEARGFGVNVIGYIWHFVFLLHKFSLSVAVCLRNKRRSGALQQTALSFYLGLFELFELDCARGARPLSRL